MVEERSADEKLDASKYKGFEVDTWKDIAWKYGDNAIRTPEQLDWTQFRLVDPIKDKRGDKALDGETYFIVDNSNKEMPIRVVDSDRILLNFNSLLPAGVKPTNKIDSKIRDSLYRNANFKSQDYEKYEMVQVQGDNEDVPKRHFIKQRLAQANIRLKRTFGISYVKQRESKQNGVEGIYRQVPPMVIQCSSMIQPFSESENPSLIHQLQEEIETLFASTAPNSPLGDSAGRVFNVMPAIHETCFRDYLLELTSNRLNKIDRKTPEGMVSVQMSNMSHLYHLLHSCLFACT